MAVRDNAQVVSIFYEKEVVLVLLKLTCLLLNICSSAFKNETPRLHMNNVKENLSIWKHGPYTLVVKKVTLTCITVKLVVF